MPGNKAYHLLHTVSNIPRPQLKFKDKIDNSSCAFLPKLKEKYNAQKSLSESLMCDIEKSLCYPHPYQYELDQFQPPDCQLQALIPWIPADVRTTPVQYIDKEETLQYLCKHLKKENAIAVDLEHHSLHSFLGITCLMQISTRTQDFLIDTLLLRSELHIFNDVFTDPSIVKVFHGADLDIGWLQRDLGLYVVNMFDTGQASHVLNMTGHSLGYLQQHYCDVQTDKQFQMADWRVRPLPQKMVAYACRDTHYLLYIYDRMKNELLQRSTEHNLLQTVLTKSKKICAKVYTKPVLSDKSHLNVLRNKKKKFNSQQLEALKGLYVWRDKVARMEDESPGYILTNRMMLQIAELLPSEQEGILDCCKPASPLLKQSLNDLMIITQAAREKPLVDTRKPDASEVQDHTPQPTQINPLWLIGLIIGVYAIYTIPVAYYLFAICTILVVYYIICVLKPRPQASSHGFAATGWEPVAEVFREQIKSGELKGGALSVYHNGELVVELFGGQADPHSNTEWGRNTVTQVYSATIGVAAIVMAMLVDRGLISYFEPVSKYWPEFAVQGKRNITVEQLLSHRAGLPIIDQEFSIHDVLTNPGKVGEILAGQEPVWKPGTRHGYHGLPFGLYVDQLVRHVDPCKRDLSTFFNEEIALPFGIDFHIGLSNDENYHCARVFSSSIFSRDIIFAWRYYLVLFAYYTDKDSLICRQLTNPLDMDPINDPQHRKIPCGSTHGFGTATSLAKLFGILSDGGVYNGKQLLSKAVIDHLTEPLSVGWDRVLHMFITYGRGTILRDVDPSGYMFGWTGTGGQMGYADSQHKLGISFLTNHWSLFDLGDDPRYLALERAIYRCIPGTYKEETSPWYW